MSNNHSCTLSIDHQSFSVVSARIVDTLNQAYRGDFMLRINAPLSAATWLGQKALCCFVFNEQSRYFHGVITAVKCSGSACYVTIESPLCLLQYRIRSRRFASIATTDLFRKILDENDWFHRSNVSFQLDDILHEYIEQHQCADLDFFHRMMNALDAVYYVTAEEKSINLHIETADLGRTVVTYPFLPERAGESGTPKINAIQTAEQGYHCVSNILALHPNSVFQLIGHPDIGLCQTYRVLRSEHCWQSNDIVYEHRLWVKSMTDKTLPPYLKTHDIHYLTLRKLDPQDEYREPVVSNYQSKELGLHFPLLDNTCVVVGRLQEQPDKPVILGALYDDHYRHPVTAEYGDQHLIQTQAGHALRMKDDGFEQSIMLNTPGEAQLLRMTQSQDVNQIEIINATGAVALNSAKNISMQAETLQCHSKENHQILGKSVSICADQASIQFQNGQDMNVSSQQNMLIRAEKQMNMNVTKDLNCVFKQDVGLSCQEDISITSRHGAIHLHSSQTLSLQAAELLVEVGASSMHIADDICMTASSIEFIGNEIRINQPSIINK